jgi:hypothetical protein
MRSAKSRYSPNKAIVSSVALACLATTSSMSFADMSFDVQAMNLASTSYFSQLVHPFGMTNMVGRNSFSDDVSGNGRGGSADAVLAWNNAAGGNWGTASNWTPNQVPTAADSATFGLASTYTVTLPVSATADRIIGSNGNVTLSGGTLVAANQTAAGTGTDVGTIGILSGTSGGPAQTLTFSGGAKVTYQSAFAGQSNTASGKLVITGTGTEFIGVAGGSRLGTFAGNSSLEITNNATTSGRVLHISRSTAGTGVNTTGLISSGATVNLNPNTGAQAPGTFVGDSAGSVSALTLDNGRIVTSGTIGSFMDIGSGANSQATVTLKNGSQVTLVGDNTGTTVNRGEISLGIDTLNAGATSTLNIESGSTYNATSLFTGMINSVGAAPTSNLNISGANSSLRTDYFFSTNGGGTGPVIGTTNINITSGGKLSSGYFNLNERGGIVGSPTSATTNITVSGTGSVFEAFNGTGFQNSYILLGAGEYTTTNVTVSNGGLFQAVDNDGTGGSFLTVASDPNSTASLTVNTNGRVVGGLSFGVADNRNTTATLNVASGGRVEFLDQLTFASSTFAVGSTGAAATVSITGGSKVLSTGTGADAGNAFIALDQDDVANITVSGAGSELATPGGGLSFGGGNQADGDFTPGGGTTNLTINSGGSVSSGVVILARDPGAAANTGARTTINIDGAGSSLKAIGPNTDPTAINDGYITTSVGLVDEFEFPIEGSGDATNSTVNINITNGGLMDAEEAIFIGDNKFGSTSITVSGVGSVIDAGRQLSINTSGLENSLTTLNISGGGVVRTTSSTTVAQGSILVGIDAPLSPAGTAATTIALTGAGSTLQSSASILLGGSFDESNVQTTGTPVTLTAGAGTSLIAAGSLDLASNSTISTAGTVAITGVSTVGGTWTISGGTDVFVGTLNAVGTGQFKLTNTVGATPTLLKTDNVLIASTAKVDLGKNAMRIRPETTSPTTLAQVKTYLALGRVTTGDGGITSTVLAANQAIGYKLVTAAGTFLGTPTLVGDILVRATIKGDSDLNGTVNFDDLLTLAQNYNVTGTGEWYTGDFTFDGNVNFDDLLNLAQNYSAVLAIDGQTTGSAFITDSFAGDWALAMSLVPEPTSLATLGMASALISRRRR